MSVRGWRLLFDWSRAGTYEGTLEDVSPYVSDDEMTIAVGRTSSQAGSDMGVGTLSFALQERDDWGSLKFAPGPLSTSAIAGKIEPGTPAVLDVDYAGAITTLFVGQLDKFKYHVQRRALRGTIMDAWGKPSGERLSTAVYQGERTGILIGVVLDAIGWPADKRDLDPGATLVPYWWEDGTDAATAVQKLVDSEGPPAIAYVEAGVFTFRDRHHRVLRSASTTSQGTYTHIYPAGSGPTTDFKILSGEQEWEHGLSNIINTASFQVDIRTPDNPSVVWSSDSPISVGAGKTVSYTVTASTPFINAITPVQATIYDDNGVPANGDYVLAGGTLAAITLSRTSGQSLTLSLTAGGTDTMITYIQMRASSLTVDRTQKVEVQDAGSVAAKDIQTWPGAVPWANPNDAYAIAQRIVAIYAVARPVMTFEIEASLTNAAGVAYMTQFLARKVSDRITVRHDLLGFNGDCHIERVERVITGLGKGLVKLRLTVEPCAPTGAVNPFTFDVAGKGFNDGQFDLDGVENGATVFRFDVAGQGFDQGRFGS